MGLGSLVFTIPHFISEKWDWTYDSKSMCNPSNTTVHDVPCPSNSTDSELRDISYLKLLFIGGQLLHGIGSSPLLTLGLVYLDDSLTRTQSPLYMGIFLAGIILGPALGYIGGGQLLEIYTDFMVVDVQELEVDVYSSPNFIGAWWMGFAITGLLCIIVSIPMAGFPRELAGNSARRAERTAASTASIKHVKTELNAKLEEYGYTGTLRQAPSVLRLLLSSGPYMYLNLAVAMEALLLTAFATYTPKYLETQFSFSPSVAGFMVGAVTIPAGVAGVIIGGYLVKHFDMQCEHILLYCAFVTLCQMFMTLIFIVQCPRAPLQGLVNYRHAVHPQDLLKFNNCSAHCHCSWDYEPICGFDGSQYYSGCFAGCTWSYKGKEVDGVQRDIEVYGNCSCIKLPRQSNQTTISIKGYGDVMAFKEPCKNDCSAQYVWFLIVVFFLAFMSFMKHAPILSATFRIVADSTRSMALGCQSIIMTLLGTIPGPPVFGFLIDRACMIWSWDECSNTRGACHIYSNQTMSTYILFLAMGGKALASFLFYVAWLLYCRQVKKYREKMDNLPGNQPDNERLTKY